MGAQGLGQDGSTVRLSSGMPEAQEKIYREAVKICLRPILNNYLELNNHRGPVRGPL